MKRYIKALLLMVTMMLFLTGCNIKEKVGNEIAEEVIEKSTDEDVDVDINGDDVSIYSEDGSMTYNDESLTIEGEDGSVVNAGGEYEWPTDQAAAELPEFKKGTINYIYNSQSSCMLSINDVEENDYVDYKDLMISKGYDSETIESSVDNSTMYSAKSLDEYSIILLYNITEKNLTITFELPVK